MNATRTVIISPDASVRSYLRDVLERSGAAMVAGEAGNGHQGLISAAAHGPNLVLVDSDLPGLSGLSIAAIIKRSYLGTQVILLGALADFDLLHASMRCGGASALGRDADAATILRTVRAVLAQQQGYHPWPIQAEPIYADGFVPGQDELIQRTLTDRQAAVLDCLLIGLTARELPDALGTTRYRVRKEMTEMMGALGVNRKVSAVATALERGWVSAGNRPVVVTIEQPAVSSGHMSGLRSPEWRTLLGQGYVRELVM